MFELRWEPGAAVTGGQERLGLDGLLARRGRRARWAAVPGSAASGGRGIRWPCKEQRDRRWWPQGIDVQGGMAVVSWHHKGDGVDDAARVTFVDLQSLRFWHVPLVGPDLQPIAIHAGGVVWHGDLLYVADTFGGLRQFDTRDIILLDDKPVLPQSGGFASQHVEGERALRYSFVSRDHDGARFVAGEYRNAEDDARLMTVPLDGGEPEVHRGPKRMQGACVVDGTWYLTTSNGHDNGDLWVGHPGAFVRHAGVLPPGPEDLAREPGTRRLWSLAEYPRSRFIYAIDLDTAL
jgi:hypothetical protein